MNMYKNMYLPEIGYRQADCNKNANFLNKVYMPHVPRAQNDRLSPYNIYQYHITMRYLDPSNTII